MGQYGSSGTMTVWRCAPLFQGESKTIRLHLKRTWHIPGTRACYIYSKCIAVCVGGLGMHGDREGDAIIRKSNIIRCQFLYASNFCQYTSYRAYLYGML